MLLLASARPVEDVDGEWIEGVLGATLAGRGRWRPAAGGGRGEQGHDQG